MRLDPRTLARLLSENPDLEILGNEELQAEPAGTAQAQAWSEADHQAALIAWAALEARRVPELALLYAVPNGELRHPAVAKRLRAQGVKAGVPDLVLPVARNGYHGLYLELKRPGGRLSPEQRQWLEALAEQGYRATVAYGFEEARAVIMAYLGLDNTEP